MNSFLTQEQVELKERKYKIIIIIANLIFYAWLGVWYILIAASDVEIDPLFDADTIFKVLTAILLIVAVWRLKCLIKKLHPGVLSPRESLMMVHTAIFAFYILAYAGGRISYHMANFSFDHIDDYSP